MKTLVKARTAGRVHDRKVDELVGICRGLLADGALNTSEASFLQDWLMRNETFRAEYPFKQLYNRVSTALIDGVLDHDEESDLLGTLAEFVGGEWYDPVSKSTSRSSSLPYDDPAPKIDYYAGPFCVTGTFAMGTREQVVNAILDRGGLVDKTVRVKTRFLVVGDFATDDWIHSSYGRKIERAVELRSQGNKISIVSEQHWARSLPKK